ncbi:uncharacterized protein Pyn_05526 [Prunus yedoensis var. nudiflora]|uniref:Uncharacterized protein n=1 Tax=Prunus yedoensis var. nudiflora TaxID=2094558 RepID=A0A314XP72_PRUYE|nr:uncharacterized protein Pyn_05526 [Prunus yedoensis var. nudiflora]
MASVLELAYQRLRNEGLFEEEPEQNRAVIYNKTSGGWSKVRKLTGREEATGSGCGLEEANPLPFKCGEMPYNLGRGGGLHGSLPSRYSVRRMV